MEKELSKNLIVSLSFEFALEIIEYCELLEEKRKYVISNQLLKSGTSIGANVKEAQNAESKADFIHKLKIALKESNETEYWLELLKESNLINEVDCQELILLNKELIKLLISSINTLRAKT